MDLGTIGKGIAALGVMLLVIGGVLWLLGKVGLPLGRLPGDIYVEGKGFSCYMPLATMILLSIVLTILLNIVVRWLNR